MQPANLAVDFHKVLLRGHIDIHQEAVRKRDDD
jgi:hypothetical protein